MPDALPFQFILAWDRQEICWRAYPVAWKGCNEPLKQLTSIQASTVILLGQLLRVDLITLEGENVCQ